MALHQLLHPIRLGLVSFQVELDFQYGVREMYNVRGGQLSERIVVFVGVGTTPMTFQAPLNAVRIILPDGRKICVERYTDAAVARNLERHSAVIRTEHYERGRDKRSSQPNRYTERVGGGGRTAMKL
jgi:hypothetical protein